MAAASHRGTACAIAVARGPNGRRPVPGMARIANMPGNRSVSMRTTLSASAAGLLIAAFAPAQLTHTIPNGTATRAGNTSNAFPWGSDASGWPGLRLMAVYGSVNFTAATPSISTPIVITRIKWRDDDNKASGGDGRY